MPDLKTARRRTLALIAFAALTACGAPEEQAAECPAGTSGEDCAPIACGADERVEGAACVACPNGLTNAAGDDASAGDTECDVSLCAEDERVLSNKCAACPISQTNAAGDDPSRGNTRCDPILCGEDERVESFACVPCPGGQTNDKGDDSSSVDTQCDAPDEPDPVVPAADRGCVFDAEPACVVQTGGDYGDCGDVIGYAFDGSECAPALGCACEGGACPPFQTSGQCARSCGLTGWCRGDRLDGLEVPSCEPPVCVGRSFIACVDAAEDPSASMDVLFGGAAACARDAAVAPASCEAGQWVCSAAATSEALGQDPPAIACGATLHDGVTRVYCGDPG